MASIILPHRFRDQPQQVAVIDWSNPITRGLEFAWVGSDPNRIISAGRVAFGSNTAPRSHTEIGVCIAPDAGPANLQMARSPVFMSNTWTGLAFFQHNENPSSLFQSVDSPGASTNDRSLGVDADGFLTAYLYDGAPRAATDTEAVISGRAYVAAASSPGNAVEVWKNGVKVASTATSSGGYMGYSGGPIFIAGYGFGASTAASGSAAKIALIAYWSRALSAAEHIMLADNPYCFFKAARRMWLSAVTSPPPASSDHVQVFVCT